MEKIQEAWDMFTLAIAEVEHARNAYENCDDEKELRKRERELVWKNKEVAAMEAVFQLEIVKIGSYITRFKLVQQ